MSARELIERVRELLLLKPYTFQDYVRDANPQTPQELEHLERTWGRYKSGLEFGACY